MGKLVQVGSKKAKVKQGERNHLLTKGGVEVDHVAGRTIDGKNALDAEEARALILLRFSLL